MSDNPTSGQIPTHRSESSPAPQTAGCGIRCSPFIRAFTQPLTPRLECASGGVSLCPALESRLTVIAFLHDFAKLNTGFQFKVLKTGASPNARGPRSAGHIGEALWAFEQESVCDALGLRDKVDDWGEGSPPCSSPHSRTTAGPASEGTEGAARITSITDERNFVTGLHGGARRICEGLIRAWPGGHAS